MNKIVDIHTHAFADAIAPRALLTLTTNCNGQYVPVTDLTVSDLSSYLQHAGVDIAVIQPVLTKQTQFRPVNDWAASIAGPSLVAFGGLHPHTDNYKRDIDYLVSLGFKGIKLHPEYQHFVVDDPTLLPLYDYALSQNLILLFHAGADPAVQPPFRSNPSKFLHLYNTLRGGVIIAAHLGGQSQWDDVELTLAGSGVYLDTSMGTDKYDATQFRRIVDRHGADKILFGSDCPWGDPARELSALKKLLTPQEQSQILGGNACRLLSL